MQVDRLHLRGKPRELVDVVVMMRAPVAAVPHIHVGLFVLTLFRHPPVPVRKVCVNQGMSFVVCTIVSNYNYSLITLDVYSLHLAHFITSAMLAATT